MDVVNAGFGLYAEQNKSASMQSGVVSSKNNAVQMDGDSSEFKPDTLTISAEAMALLSAEQEATDADQKLNNGGGTRPPESGEKASAEQFNGGGTRPPVLPVDENN